MVHAQNQQKEVSAERMSRACVQCAASRVRCSREVPCARCSLKNIRCEYRVSSTHSPAGQSGHGDVPQSNASARPDVVEANEGVTGAIDLALALDHAPQSLDTSNLPSGEVQRPMLIDNEIAQDSTLYLTGLRHDFVPQSMSGVNWLSPGQTILQEWASQLAGITESDIFSPRLNMMDFPDSLRLLNARPEQEIGWDHASQQFPGQIQPSNCEQLDYQHPSREMESPETFVDAQSTGTSGSMGNKYYVHGVASRAPFQRRFRNSQTAAEGSVDSAKSGTKASGFTSPVTNWLTADTYTRVTLGVQEHTQSQSTLPSLDSFRLCVHLYFERSYPNFPFLNKAHFVTEEPHWILLLAVAGVGATYLLSSQGSQWKHSMMQTLETVLSERLNSVHYFQRESYSTQSANQTYGAAGVVNELLPLIQAKILHMLCMLHSSISYITHRAVFERAELVQWCSYLNLVRTSSDVSISITSDTDIQLWIQMQTRLRAGMMIWLLDSMLSYELGCRHIMKLGDIGEWLPCHEPAWERPSLANIQIAQKFSDALDTIYIEKQLPPKLSDLSHVLLIHAIYRRTIEVFDQSRMRLSTWNPTASVQTLTSEPSPTQEWPPSSSIVSNWRNAACDSLDILNWAANSNAAESCWEEPTILYLHLSRLILLAPTDHFQTLVKYPAMNKQGWPNSTTSGLQQYEHARSQVLQWAIRDQFKARLSVVHAGALLWHVRRFSTNNVIEPFSIYIATLLLWAYSASTSAIGSHDSATCRASHDITQNGKDGAWLDDSDDEPSWIRLDRPLDDELVQTYIHVGDKMSAHLKGVGDIVKHGAPLKILKQGLYLLTGEKYGGNAKDSNSGSILEEVTTYTWDIQRSYAETIRRMITATNTC
ncbi:uncharacterized protein N7511_006911 [Penicillium nucicola]|uniref:uncharacterized protein n=1 Tax=Penicillium nucicola TaxID=1850975 RepID=UPI0025456462|nr:uncharacterized protein N7511_006911 [Penicillium nucicola]KAJ5758217.1 hypothetical protein N7511_006911 [Penicillium nucicola]